MELVDTSGTILAMRFIFLIVTKFQLGCWCWLVKKVLVVDGGCLVIGWSHCFIYKTAESAGAKKIFVLSAPNLLKGCLGLLSRQSLFGLLFLLY